MATDGLEFALTLKNQVSGPAMAAKQALSQLKNEAKATDARIKELDRANKIYALSGKQFADQIKKNSQEMARLKIKAGDLKSGISDLTPPTDKTKFSLKDLAGEMFGIQVGATLFVDILKKVGEVAWEAAKALGHLVLEAAKIAIEAGAFREQMTATYGLFTGTAAKGKEVFDQIDALGTAIHIPTQKAHEYAKDLIAAGIEGPNRLEQAVKSVAMLNKVGGEAAANKIKGLIEETGKTQKTQFWKGGRGTFAITREDLVGTGVAIDEVYNALAKKMGKNNSQIRMMMMSGQITAAQGIDALNDVIERGKIGDTARGMVGDLGQVFTEIKDNVGKILRDVDFKGFVKEMRGVGRLLDPATSSGKTLKATLVPAFNAIFKILKEGVRAGKIGFLELAIAGFKFLIFLGPEIKMLKQSWEELKKNKSAAMGLQVAWTGLKGAIVVMLIAFKGSLVALGLMVTLFNKMDAAATATGHALRDAFEYLKNLDLKSLGAKLMTDLIEGIKGLQGTVKDAGKSVGESLKAGFKDAIGWHSPPQFFLEGGKASADAFAKGGEDGAAPSFAKQMPTLGAQGGGKSGGNTITVTVPVTITGAMPTGAQLDDFEQRMTNWANKFAVQLMGGEKAEA